MCLARGWSQICAPGISLPSSVSDLAQREGCIFCSMHASMSKVEALAIPVFVQLYSPRIYSAALHTHLQRSAAVQAHCRTPLNSQVYEGIRCTKDKNLQFPHPRSLYLKTGHKIEYYQCHKLFNVVHKRAVQPKRAVHPTELR
jgi:hypothetical protein